MAETPEMVKILDVINAAKDQKTFVLKKRLKAKSGQFCMLWLPGVDEKPMGFSKLTGNIEVTVRKAGRFTEELLKLRKGDSIGFRGPYGNGFTPVKGKVMIVGGGCGVAPLIPLAQELASLKSSIDFMVGSKTQAECLVSDGSYLKGKLEKLHKTRISTTTENILFEEEFVTIPAEMQLRSAIRDKKPYDMVYTCGPEVMMEDIMQLCLKHDTPCELSLERYMKCGIGVCGSCMLKDYRVCVDGPVFTAKQLKDTEFGKYTRTAEGRLHKI